jgi:hypothetical protein
MPDGATAPFEVAVADPEGLAAAFGKSGASDLSPSPDWSEYADRVGEEVVTWLGDIVRPFVGVLGPNFGFWLRWLIAGLAIVMAIMIAGRVFSRLRREPLALVLEAGGAKGARTPRAGEYRLRALAALDQGDAPLALTSLWWWFATSALNERPDPAMTTEDVIARSGRHDLRALARLLDKLRFGANEPTPDDVRELLAGFEARV